MATALQTASGRLMSVRGPRLGQYTNLTGGGGGGWTGGSVWSDGSNSHDGLVDDFSAMSYLAIVLSQPMIAAVANKLVRTIASRPLKVYELLDTGDRLRVRGNMRHRGAGLARLLESPMARRSSIHLKQQVAFPLVVFGNSVLGKARSDPQAPPDGLLPLNWTQLSGYAQTGGDIEWWGSTQLGGSERFVRVEETVHFAWGAPESGIGISPLDQLARTIRLEDAAVRSQTATFRNGSRAGGWVSMAPGTKTDKEAWDRMRASIELIHRGVDQHGRVGLLAPGATFSPSSFSPVDLDLMKARVYNREESCMIYDVKPPVLGADLAGMNYAGLREIYKDFQTTTMPPYYTLFEETLQAQLIDPEPEWTGMFCEFDLSDVLRGDPLQEAESVKLLIESMQLTPNEGRRIRNQPRVEDPNADKLWVAANNMQPIDTPPPAPPAPPVGATPSMLTVNRDGQGRVTTITRGAHSG